MAAPTSAVSRTSRRWRTSSPRHMVEHQASSSRRSWTRSPSGSEEAAEEDQKEVAKDETKEETEADMEQEVADDDGLDRLDGAARARRWRRWRWRWLRRRLRYRWRRDRRLRVGRDGVLGSELQLHHGRQRGGLFDDHGADGSYSLNITSATGQIVVMDDGVDISTGGSVGMMAMSVANATDVTAPDYAPDDARGYRVSTSQPSSRCSGSRYRKYIDRQPRPGRVAGVWCRRRHGDRGCYFSRRSRYSRSPTRSRRWQRSRDDPRRGRQLDHGGVR